MKKNIVLLALLMIWVSAVQHVGAAEKKLVMKPDETVIVVADKEPDPVKLAARTLASDFKKVTGTAPKITNKIPSHSNGPVIIVVNRTSGASGLDHNGLRPLDGFESHRVWADPASNRIYLDGADMRGAIFAIYTFSEQILGVPPLWYWCSWEPDRKKEIRIPSDCDIFYASPKVRFRAWYPNDTDLFTPWRKLSQDNNERWIETMLRLKLNTVEDAGSIAYPGGITADTRLFGKYGMILTSHHVVALNTVLWSWKDYWTKVRGMKEAPQLLLSNEDLLVEFWEHAARTISESGCENLWNISFRGAGDKPFWATFKDAPESEPERAAVINHMLQKQMEIIRKYSGEENPYVRITFYDEMADLISAGLVHPPVNENMIWTFCSGRRDHYPYTDIQQFNPATPVKLGYYLNFQFTSTGSHLAPGEGPWKMEFNYRYANSKSPLYFSVVNAGNLREHIYEMSANARMMWDYDSYDTDKWSRAYAAQYFGEEHADEIAALYKDYFYAYWLPRKSDFPGGMERQFVFQDQRYALAIRYISNKFYDYDPNPLPARYGHERVPGRVFRIVPEDNGADNQIDAILNGMSGSIEKFASVNRRFDKIYPKVAKEKRRFLYDNLGAYSKFMEHLSRTLYHYAYAYKHQSEHDTLVKNLNTALNEMTAARDALYGSQHGVFETWYATDSLFNMNRCISSIKTQLDKAPAR